MIVRRMSVMKYCQTASLYLHTGRGVFLKVLLQSSSSDFLPD